MKIEQENQDREDIRVKWIFKSKPTLMGLYKRTDPLQTMLKQGKKRLVRVIGIHYNETYYFYILTTLVNLKKLCYGKCEVIFRFRIFFQI